MPSPRSPLFPYTTLFRSGCAVPAQVLPEVNAPSVVAPVTPGERDLLYMPPPPQRSEERVSRNAEPEISTLSLHDALPIWLRGSCTSAAGGERSVGCCAGNSGRARPALHAAASAEIGRAGQQECRARDLHSFPTRRSSDLVARFLHKCCRR